MLEIAVLISGTGSNLQALIATAEKTQLYRINTVIADRPAAGLEYARVAGIHTQIIAPKDYDSRAAWATALASALVAHGMSSDTGLIVSAGFMRILPETFVSQFEPRIINIHPSLLPAFPGAQAVADALAAGVETTGTTVHLVDAGMDSGRILQQQMVAVHPTDTVASLHERIKAAEQVLLPQVVSAIADGQLALKSS